MSDLIVIAYDDQYKGEEMRTKLLKLQRDYLVDVEDAVVAVRKPDGKVKLSQSIHLAEMGAMQGGFIGLLIGILFFSPLLGWAAGAATGAISGALSDIGIDDNFMKELAKSLKPGSSALFVLVRKVTPDKVLEEIKGSGGTVIKTSLTHEEEKKLQEALNAVKAEAAQQPVKA
jgi:uncharacterized membrane protein